VPATEYPHTVFTQTYTGCREKRTCAPRATCDRVRRRSVSSLRCRDGAAHAHALTHTRHRCTCRRARAEVVGVTGERVRVLRAPNLGAVRRRLAAVLQRGVTSLAVVFLHSYTFGQHERAVGALAREIGFAHVSLSSEVSRP
jgi:N-methylhydantoinase A/oxoprolinase/acetone carboxylase beta subunit